MKLLIFIALLKIANIFATNDEWLIDLMSICNRVKHNSLDITKPEREKVGTTIDSSSGSTFIQGDLQMHNNNGQLFVYGEGAIHTGGDNVAVYANGDDSFSIKFGNDSINIDKDNNIELNNIIITNKDKNIITFTNGKELISELDKMYNGVSMVYNSLKQWI